jgi:hypothetical protein
VKGFFKELEEGSYFEEDLPLPAALSLRSRHSGTKFAEPLWVRSLSADVFQGSVWGDLPQNITLLKWV